ncbi:MAG: hypothetical protein MHMPM18_002046 [Marteilia pararefringens]
MPGCLQLLRNRLGNHKLKVAHTLFLSASILQPLMWSVVGDSDSNPLKISTTQPKSVFTMIEVFSCLYLASTVLFIAFHSLTNIFKNACMRKSIEVTAICQLIFTTISIICDLVLSVIDNQAKRHTILRIVVSQSFVLKFYHFIFAVWEYIAIRKSMNSIDETGTLAQKINNENMKKLLPAIVLIMYSIINMIFGLILENLIIILHLPIVQAAYREQEVWIMLFFMLLAIIANYFDLFCIDAATPIYFTKKIARYASVCLNILSLISIAVFLIITANKHSGRDYSKPIDIILILIIQICSSGNF